jgi:DNA-binding transcriptional ArsR family regulator
MTTATLISHPVREALDIATVLHALSDPVRLQIVSGLAADEGRSCGSFGLPVTKSTCTHHFKVLREAGVIEQRQVGTSRLNSLRREDLDARFPGLLDTILAATVS